MTLNTNGWSLDEINEQIVSHQLALQMKPYKYHDPEQMEHFLTLDDELHDLCVKAEGMKALDSMSQDANIFFE